eukprot:tig00000852_g5054.t1
MAGSLVWSDLSVSQLQSLEGKLYSEEGIALLAEYVGLRRPAPLSREDVDFEFSVEKTSAFFSIVKANHAKLEEENLGLKKSFEFFQSLLIRHSVQRPPFSVGLFSLPDVKLITDYVVDTYYRHFKLYQHAFTRLPVLDVDSTDTLVELPPFFPPLSEGVPEWLPKPPPDYEAIAAAEREAAVEKLKEAQVGGQGMQEVINAAVSSHLAVIREQIASEIAKSAGQFMEKLSEFEVKMEEPLKKPAGKK